MKVLYSTVLFLLCCLNTFAQKSIEGKWYSRDSSRIYMIYPKGNGYEANLYQTKRANEKNGELVLLNLTYNQQKKRYKGSIRAINDGMAVNVKISIEDNGKILRLKLRRMLLFPVFLQWHKVE
jgi:uncharacterized protein (DUF2147 family)